MKAVVAAFNQEKALVGAFSVITNLRMDLFEALSYVVAAEDLVDDEDDDLEDGHDDQLQRRGDAEHHAEADEDGRGGEVRGDERAHVHVDVGPGAVAVGRGELLGVGDPILVNLGSR